MAGTTQPVAILRQATEFPLKKGNEKEAGRPGPPPSLIFAPSPQTLSFLSTFSGTCSRC